MVGLLRPLNVHFPHYFLSKLDSAEDGFSSGCEYGVCKTLLIKAAAALLIWCIATAAKHTSESGAVQ